MISINKLVNGYSADYTGFYRPKKPSAAIAILLPHLIATLPFLNPNKAMYGVFNSDIELISHTLTHVLMMTFIFKLPLKGILYEKATYCRNNDQHYDGFKYELGE
ncbi:MAG: hypothetical protein ACJAZA_001357 [Shewanella psychromarinicola]